MTLRFSIFTALSAAAALWGCGERGASSDASNGGSSNDAMSSGGAVANGGNDSVQGGSGNPGGSNNPGGSSNAGGSGNSGEGCSKRGVAYAFDAASAGPDMTAMLPSLKWFYDWGTRPAAAIGNLYAGMGVEFVPMVHDGHFTVNDVSQQIPAGAKYLLTFNEPNFGNQANLTPEAAAALWPQIEQIADAHDLKIVSPALNYCGGDCNETDPFVWLNEFFAACSNCRVDYVAAHWYNCDVGELDNYLNSYRAYNRPIWLTEFACWFGPHQPYSEDQAKAYAHDAAVYLDQRADVFRYSWFTGRTNDVPNASLLGGSGALTNVGNAYVTAQAPTCP